MTVRFTLDGGDVELAPKYLEDWIDPRIITAINERIAASGRQFTLVKAFDQTAFLLALDEGRAGSPRSPRVVLRVGRRGQARYFTARTSTSRMSGSFASSCGPTSPGPPGSDPKGAPAGLPRR